MCSKLTKYIMVVKPFNLIGLERVTITDSHLQDFDSHLQDFDSHLQDFYNFYKYIFYKFVP